MASEAGKGSKPRPFSVTQEHFASEWDRIFGHSSQQNEAKVHLKQADNADILPDTHPEEEIAYFLKEQAE